MMNNENNEGFDFKRIEVESITYYNEIGEVEESKDQDSEWNIELIEHKNANAAEVGNQIIYG